MDKKTFRKLSSLIHEILYREWDPIGCGVPEDEYDGYIPQVCKRMEEGDPRALADYLTQIVTHSIGLPADPTKDERVSRLLMDAYAKVVKGS